MSKTTQELSDLENAIEYYLSEGYPQELAEELATLDLERE